MGLVAVTSTKTLVGEDSPREIAPMDFVAAIGDRGAGGSCGCTLKLVLESSVAKIMLMLIIELLFEKKMLLMVVMMVGVCCTRKFGVMWIVKSKNETSWCKYFM